MGEKQKIAILGGGVGAISTAFELTDYAGWQDKYDVTVYTEGWRLGGKGSSGRNYDVADRVEEHGLHVWFGCYQNAFHMMRKVYQEQSEKSLAPDSPLQSCFDAFQPHDRISLVSQTGITWTTNFAVHAGLPGDDFDPNLTEQGAPPDPVQYVLYLLDSLSHHLTGASSGMLAGADSGGLPAPVLAAMRLLQVPLNLQAGVIHGLLGAARALVQMPGWHQSNAHHGCLRGLLGYFHKRLFRAIQHRAAFSPSALNLLYNADLYIPIIRGIIADGVLFRGFEAIDGCELRTWLKNHGAVLADESPIVKSIYDPVFAYQDGDPKQPHFAAGTAIQAHFKLLFTHRGHVCYVMQAGMGDIVFAPLYLVLKDRGVKFEFFHRVRDLGLSEDGKNIDRIEFEAQAKPEGAVHVPLRYVKGLPVWPNQPIFKKSGEYDYDEEDTEREQSSNGVCGGTGRLERGRDFDIVVLGISLGALPSICSSLIKHNQHWRDMIEHVKTTPTQAIQIWLKKSGAEMGWDHGTPWPDSARALAIGFVEPFDSFADFSHVIPYENWDPEDHVRQVLCFCNCLPSASLRDANPEHVVFENAVQFLKTKTGVILPNGTLRDHPQELDWNLLVDRNNREGPERLESQYIRANYQGSELYVLSVEGSTQYRLRPDQSHFDNLYLAGDWTWNNINIGCVEAAVISARLAAKAICGKTKVFYNCGTRVQDQLKRNRSTGV